MKVKTEQPAQEGDHQQQLDLVFDDEDTAQKQRTHGVKERRDQERLFGVLAEGFAVQRGGAFVADHTVFGIALDGHEKRAAQPVAQHDGDRRQIVRRYEKPAQQQADGIVDGLRQYVQIRDILGAEGLDIVQNTHHQQPQLAYKERDVHQQRSAKPNRGQHRIFRGNDFSAHGVLHHGAFFLGGMVLVEPGVQPFADDIVGRGDHAGAEETDQRDTGQAAVGALPAYQQQREQRAGEDEQVFDPVVRTGDLDIVFHVEERPFLFKAVRGSGQGVPLEPFGRAVSQKRQHGRTGCREVHQIDVE